MAAKHIKKITPNVEQLLKVSTECRNSDMILWLAYCANNHDLINLIGSTNFNKLKKFMQNFDVPTVETVGRIRRKFQERGEYLSSKKIQTAKKLEVRKMQKELGYNVTL